MDDDLSPVMRETLAALKRCQTLDERLAVYNAGIICLGMELVTPPLTIWERFAAIHELSKP